MIDLLIIGKQMEIKWQGNVYYSDNTIENINSALKKSFSSKNPYVLLWLGNFTPPEYPRIKSLLSGPADVIHSGLKLGMGGKPFLLNFISPTWMFNKDPDNTEQKIASFRMHIYGTLIKKEALQNIGLFDEDFESIEGAALDMGLRMIKGGAFIIYEPKILKTPKKEFVYKENRIPVQDEVRMLQKHYSKRQITWALLRSLSYGYSPEKIIIGFKQLYSKDTIKAHIWKRRIPEDFILRDKHEYKVSVIIPTLKRHKYISRVLSALRKQTIKPYEVIVIDEDLYPEFYSHFEDLPLKVLKDDKKGQSTARNKGLHMASGDYILIVDDDIDQIPENFIETHIKFLKYFKTDVSCGTVTERDIDFKIHRFQKFVKVADFFPTDNVLFKHGILKRSGYFDIKFDKGMQEDHDLGMRIYLSSYIMGVNPFADVYHHHAPSGGLREHNARVITFSLSRKNIFKRNLLHKTSIYLYKKYYKDFQVKEEILLNIRGTFVIKGSILKKIAKVIAAFVLLPHTCAVLFLRSRAATKMLKDHLTTQSSD